MKKLLLAELAVLLVLSLGCTSNAITNPRQTNPQQTEEPRASIRGEYDGDAFKNEFSTIKFALPKGWTYQSEDELLSQQNELNKIMGQKGSEEYVFLDMCAVDGKTGQSAQVCYENLSLTYPGGTLSASDYMKIITTKPAQGTTYDELTTTKIGNNVYMMLCAHNEKYLQHTLARRIDEGPMENYMVVIVFTTGTQKQYESLLKRFS